MTNIHYAKKVKRLLFTEEQKQNSSGKAKVSCPGLLAVTQGHREINSLSSGTDFLCDVDKCCKDKEHIWECMENKAVKSET